MPTRASEDGPVTYPDGTRKWWKNGRLHRLNGPAVERPDTVITPYPAYYVNGAPVSGRSLVLLSQAQHPDLTDTQALTILDTVPRSVRPLICHYLAQNTSEFLSNQVRGLAALTC